MINPETYEFDDEDEEYYAYRRSVLSTLYAESEDDAFPESNWNPFVPNPPPLTTNRLKGRLIPRAPIRLDNPMQGGQSGQGGGLPPKQDPRMTRFTEAVQMVINALFDSGDIYSTAPQKFAISYIIPQIPGSEAQLGQVFYNTDTGMVSWKDNNGVVFGFTSAGGLGAIDGGSA